MARPRSEDKRLAILSAATDAVAAAGVTASTALIARRAGVAEGTVFRYFESKDTLLNALFMHLKTELRAATPPPHADMSPRARLREAWDTYVDWGIANAVACKALSQLAVSDRINAETRAETDALFAEIGQMAGELLGGFASRAGIRFADAVFIAMAELAMQFAARDPSRTGEYRSAGFEMLYAGFVAGA